MTREALALYLRHMKPTGVIAFHISNRHLDLAPVLKRLGDDAGLQALRVRFEPERGNPTLEHTSDYVLLTRDARFMADPMVQERAEPMAPDTAARAALWTDDFSNLLGVLKWQQ
jgi:hypothetical protein